MPIGETLISITLTTNALHPDHVMQTHVLSSSSPPPPPPPPSPPSISVLIPTHTHKGTSLGSLLRTSCAHGVSNLITCPESVLNFRGSHGCETKGIKLTRYTHVSQIKKEGTWVGLLGGSTEGNLIVNEESIGKDSARQLQLQ